MQDYEVQDVVDDLSQQLASTALRAALAEAKLKGAEKRVEALQEQLSAALGDLTRLADQGSELVIEQETRPY